MRDEVTTEHELAALYRGIEKHRRARRTSHCTLGVGCEESGMCYAAAVGSPQECGAVYADA